MDSTSRYRVNSPKVIHEFFEDEVVIVNLESGCYYSTDKIGFAVFNHLIAHASITEIIEILSGQYNMPAENISQSITDFISKLSDEVLICPNGQDSPQHAHASTISDLSLPSPRLAQFEPPVLNKYSDMKDLLLLDPIHDVDEKGWPIAKK